MYGRHVERSLSVASLCSPPHRPCCPEHEWWLLRSSCHLMSVRSANGSAPVGFGRANAPNRHIKNRSVPWGSGGYVGNRNASAEPRIPPHHTTNAPAPTTSALGLFVHTPRSERRTLGLNQSSTREGSRGTGCVRCSVKGSKYVLPLANSPKIFSSFWARVLLYG